MKECKRIYLNKNIDIEILTFFSSQIKMDNANIPYSSQDYDKIIPSSYKNNDYFKSNSWYFLSFQLKEQLDYYELEVSYLKRFYQIDFENFLSFLKPFIITKQQIQKINNTKSKQEHCDIINSLQDNTICNKNINESKENLDNLNSLKTSQNIKTILSSDNYADICNLPDLFAKEYFNEKQWFNNNGKNGFLYSTQIDDFLFEKLTDLFKNNQNNLDFAKIYALGYLKSSMDLFASLQMMYQKEIHLKQIVYAYSSFNIITKTLNCLKKHKYSVVELIKETEIEEEKIINCMNYLLEEKIVFNNKNFYFIENEYKDTIIALSLLDV